MDNALKIGFGIFSVLALVFGFVTISRNVKLTIALPQTDGVAEDGAAAALPQFLDTDEDGLNDQQELSLYGTSPYLADSDSDGISDPDELAQGTDPNCPEGTNCGSSFADSAQTPEPENLNILDETVFGGDQNTAQVLEALALLQSGQTPSPDQIRLILKASGVTDEQLAGATDEDLVQLIQEVEIQLESAPASQQ